MQRHNLAYIALGKRIDYSIIPQLPLKMWRKCSEKWWKRNRRRLCENVL